MSRARTSERVDAFERHQFRDGAHLQMYVEQWCHDKPETLLLVKGDVLLDHPSGRGMQVPITNEAWSLVKAAPDLKSALTAVTVDVDENILRLQVTVHDVQRVQMTDGETNLRDVKSR